MKASDVVREAQQKAMYAAEHLRRQVREQLGDDMLLLIDLVAATSPHATPAPKLSRAEKHTLNAAAHRSDSQRRRAGYSNAVQAQKRREAQVRARADFDPYP